MKPNVGSEMEDMIRENFDESMSLGCATKQWIISLSSLRLTKL